MSNPQKLAEIKGLLRRLSLCPSICPPTSGDKRRNIRPTVVSPEPSASGPRSVEIVHIWTLADMRDHVCDHATDVIVSVDVDVWLDSSSISFGGFWWKAKHLKFRNCPAFDTELEFVGYACRQGTKRIFADGWYVEGPFVITSNEEPPTNMRIWKAFQQIEEELARNDPVGWTCDAVERLAEIMLLNMMRTGVERAVQGDANVPASLDMRLLRVLMKIGRDPFHDWSVAELARSAGMSRTAFAVHFTCISAVAVPPLAWAGGG